MSEPQGLVRLEGLGELQKCSDLIGKRTRDLPACSIAPQPILYVLPDSVGSFSRMTAVQGTVFMPSKHRVMLSPRAGICKGLREIAKWVFRVINGCWDNLSHHVAELKGKVFPALN
jgi:hypothetical protein